jgi:hypothetical protein
VGLDKYMCLTSRGIKCINRWLASAYLVLTQNKADSYVGRGILDVVGTVAFGDTAEGTRSGTSQ